MKCEVWFCDRPAVSVIVGFLSKGYCERHLFAAEAFKNPDDKVMTVEQYKVLKIKAKL